MTYRVRFHPLVEQDLEAIAQWIIEYAGSEVADGKIAEKEQEIASLARTPHRGSIPRRNRSRLARHSGRKKGGDYVFSRRRCQGGSHSLCNLQRRRLGDT